MTSRVSSNRVSSEVMAVVYWRMQSVFTTYYLSKFVVSGRVSG